MKIMIIYMLNDNCFFIAYLQSKQKYLDELKVLQYFGKVRHNLAVLDAFPTESDNPNWTVRYCAHLILSKCYLTD